MIVRNLPAALRAYQAFGHIVPVFAKRHIRKRMRLDKEHPTRWTERLGKASIARPKGTLIWLHAVGLGEVMSLRGLVEAMAAQSDAHFLITSGTKAAANALAKNTPPRTLHQFLPLDAPRYRKAFLDHWQPDLCVWAEQDLWPGFMLDIAKRGISQAYIVARISAESARKKSRFKAAYSHLFKQMALVTAYDHDTKECLKDFGVNDVSLTGSIKPTAPPLTCDEAELRVLQNVLAGRFVWIVAPSHAADEAVAIEAHKLLMEKNPKALLIIAPRYPKRAFDFDLPHATRSKSEIPQAHHNVYLADTFGDLGLLYRLTSAALIGGSFDAIDGHSPWEAANLDTAIFHGPRTTNFADDYAALNAAGSAIQVSSAEDLLKGLQGDLTKQIAHSNTVIQTYRAKTEELAQDLLGLL